MYVNGTRVLGPTTFSFGFEFARDQFHTCACSCSLDCASLHRSCCLSETQCGPCLPGFESNSSDGRCNKIGIIIILISYSLLFALPPLSVFSFVFILIQFKKNVEFIDLDPIESRAWKEVFNGTDGWYWPECNTEEVYLNPCATCGRVRCEWNGQNYVITDLSLNSMGLSGFIPVQISHFTQLRGLDLSSNEFTGPIPTQFSHLKQLQGLSLFINQLSGDLPVELFQLTNLQQFSVYANLLSGSIPPEIENLQNIQRISFDLNRFNGSVPPQLFQLRNLTILFLDLNELSGTIPESVGGLTSIRELYMHSNDFIGSIPPQIGLLKQLEVFYLSENRLTGTIPHEISNLEKLAIFSCHSNQLNGTIPSSIAGLSNLQELYLGDNQLSGNLPAEVFQLDHLQDLSVHSNQLSGTISEEIGSLINLRRVDLYSNKFTGSIPSNISRLTNIEQLLLHSNSLNGTIPRELSLLTQLGTIQLYSNRLTGTVPNELEALSNLQSFFVHHNQLSGSVPLFLSMIPKLESVDISYNQFSGQFPEFWNDRDLYWGYINAKNAEVSPFFNSLRRFKACCNALSGKLRDFTAPFLNINNFVQMDLSNNNITGSFHSPLWNGFWFQFGLRGFQQDGLSSLVYLDVSNNKIEQNLPSFLPSSLSIFFTSNNRLVGSIPDSFAQLFVFLSKNNKLKSDTLPSFFRAVPGSYIDFSSMPNRSVECLQLQTADRSAKVFDFGPEYDQFHRCRCKAGYFNFHLIPSDAAYSRCDPAPEGHFVPEGSRLLQPLRCPAGKFAKGIANTRCEDCASNFFSMGGDSRCHPCLSKTDCEDGIIRLKLHKWINASRKVDQNTRDEHIYDCLNSEACIVNGSTMRCAWELGYDNSSVLCSECLKGYFTSDRLRKTCDECNNANTILTIVIGGVMVIIAVIFVIHKIVKVHKSAIFSKSERMTYVQHQTQSDKKGLVRVLVGHIQILIILSDLQMRGSDIFHKTIDSTFGSFIPSFSPAAVKCSLNVTFRSSITIATITPLFLAAFLGILVFFVTFALKITMKTALRSTLSVFVFLFYLIHPSLMKQLLQVFQMHHQQIEGEWYLQSDMFITQTSSNYSTILVVALLGIILHGILAPFSAVIALYNRAQSVNNHGESMINDPLFEAEFGFLYLGYKSGGFLYLWELIIYFRKTILLVVSVFTGQDRFLQSYLTTLILIIAQIIHNKFQPYRSLRLNRVETQSLGVLGVTQMSMLLSSQYVHQSQAKSFELWIAVFLLIMNTSFFLSIIWIVLKDSEIGQKLYKKLTKAQEKKAVVMRRVSMAITGKSQVYPSVKQEAPLKIDWSPVLNQCQQIMDTVNHLDQSQSKNDMYIHEILSSSVQLLVEIQQVCNMGLKSRFFSIDGCDSCEEEKSIEEIEKGIASRGVEVVGTFKVPKRKKRISKQLQKRYHIEDAERSDMDEVLQCTSMECIGSQLHALWHKFYKLARKSQKNLVPIIEQDEQDEQEYSKQDNNQKVEERVQVTSSNQTKS